MQRFQVRSLSTTKSRFFWCDSSTPVSLRTPYIACGNPYKTKKQLDHPIVLLITSIWLLWSDIQQQGAQRLWRLSKRHGRVTSPKSFTSSALSFARSARLCATCLSSSSVGKCSMITSWLLPISRTYWKQRRKYLRYRWNNWSIQQTNKTALSRVTVFLHTRVWTPLI